MNCDIRDGREMATMTENSIQVPDASTILMESNCNDKKKKKREENMNMKYFQQQRDNGYQDSSQIFLNCFLSS